MQAKAKCVSLDLISNIPSSIIENILCLVPIKEAVRTSILSKKWKYNWVKIPKLVFNEKDMFDEPAGGHQLSVLEQTFEKPPSERKQLTRKCKMFYAIYQVLLLHKGPILEFSLSMEADDTCVEIDQIIIHLARNNNPLKKLSLTLSEMDMSSYKLPLCIFWLHQLTDLYIDNCTLSLNPTFTGFGTLTSLYIKGGDISIETLLHLLSNCPLLKRLTLVLLWDYLDKDIVINELFKCLIVIEHLSIWHSTIKCFPTRPPDHPIALVHLKSFFYEMTLLEDEGLQFLGIVIRSSPNLEKIKIEVNNYLLFDYEIPVDYVSPVLEDFSDIWLEHLKEVEIVGFDGLKGELEFVRLILAKSPVLKKMGIIVPRWVDKDQEIQMLRTLLRSPRASPLLEIIVECDRKRRI